MVKDKRQQTNYYISMAKKLLKLYDSYDSTVGNPCAASNGGGSPALYKPSDPGMFQAIDFMSDFDRALAGFPHLKAFVTGTIDGTIDLEEDLYDEQLLALGKRLIARKVNTYVL